MARTIPERSISSKGMGVPEYEVCFTHPCRQYCWRWRLMSLRQVPSRCFRRMLLRIRRHSAQNLRQWVLGRAVCTARQSGHRHRFIQRDAGYPRRSSAARIRGPRGVRLRSEGSDGSWATGSRFSVLEVPPNQPIGRVPGDLTTCVKLGYPAFTAPCTPFLSVDLLCEIKGLVSGILEKPGEIRSN